MNGSIAGSTIKPMQPEALKALVLDALERLKAENIAVLEVKQYASFTDYMVFASGASNRHVSAIAEAVIEAAKQAGHPPLGVEGLEVGDWVLVDLGDVVMHVMLTATRAFYELEKLWGEEMADSA